MLFVIFIHLKLLIVNILVCILVFFDVDEDLKTEADDERNGSREQGNQASRNKDHETDNERR